MGIFRFCLPICNKERCVCRRLYKLYILLITLLVCAYMSILFFFSQKFLKSIPRNESLSHRIWRHYEVELIQSKLFKASSFKVIPLWFCDDLHLLTHQAQFHLWAICYSACLLTILSTAFGCLHKNHLLNQEFMVKFSSKISSSKSLNMLQTGENNYMNNKKFLI